jgi:hypothetical protein
MQNRPLYDDQLVPSPVTGNFISDIAAPVFRLYWGRSQISPEIHQELRAMSHMAPLFERVLKENPKALASHSISASGIGHYCTMKPKYKKVASEIPPPSVFDLRNGEPMTIFTNAENQSKDVRWTDIYKDDVIEGFMLTASAPIYDDEEQFRGITGIDVPLATLIDEMLQNASHQDEQRLLFSFILDEDSKVIVFPKRYYPLFGLEPASSEYRYSSDRLSLYLSDSFHDNVTKLAASSTSSSEHQQKLLLNGENYYVITSKMQKQGWVYGVVVRESDMMNNIHASRRELDQTIGEMAGKSIVFRFPPLVLPSLSSFFCLNISSPHSANFPRQLNR